ncbi:MAG: hypothetical protein EOS27_16560 [Mesorhizobium sp.]|nr:MAG: hypothetical protein EOS27_16560 [Mesorhizobium sp.]
MAVSSNSIALPGGKNLSRRSILGGLAIASVGAAAGASAPREMTAHERYAYHLAEMKKAAEEFDPRIANWHVVDKLGDEDNSSCGLIISAHFRRGRYEGDGLYWTGYDNYRVKLLADRDKETGKRMFSYRDRGRDHVIREDALEAFIVRKVSD